MCTISVVIEIASFLIHLLIDNDNNNNNKQVMTQHIHWLHGILTQTYPQDFRPKYESITRALDRNY